MRYLNWSLALLVLFAPVATASGTETVSVREVVPTVVSEEPRGGALQTGEIVLEERTAVDAAAVRNLPSRGSFWWMVGVIVVAGVILSVLL